MSLYHFRTFRTSYFFPAIAQDENFLYRLYQPYGSILSKMYWWLFTHSWFVRRANLVKEPNEIFPYNRIKSLCPKGAKISFNMGTPGVEQKISMLGVEENGKHFFAKFSYKDRPIEMSKNEIRVLDFLKGTGLAPDLFDYKIGKDFVFFRTSCVNGIPLDSLRVSQKIVDLALAVNNNNVRIDSSTGLITCLSHGDFTPWNVMVENGFYKLIDWELSAQRVLGYDLFLFITQFIEDGGLYETFKKSIPFIKSYFNTFGVEDWRPYLKEFLDVKIKAEREKGDNERVDFYSQIYDFKFDNNEQ